MKIKIALPSQAKQFIRDYRLPLAATAGLVIIVLCLFVVRIRDRAALGQVFDVKNSGGLDYANLLSNDKSDDFVKRDVSADDKTTANSDKPQSSNTTSSTTTIASTSTSSNTVTQPGITPTPSPTPTPTPTPVTPPPPPPFAAVISDFSQDQSPSLQCPNGLLVNISKCSKVYSFAANVQTTGGPGSVNYNWVYSVSGSSNGSFTAASGTNTTTLHNQVTLSCKNAVNFTAKFALSSPSATTSKTLQISHSC